MQFLFSGFPAVSRLTFWPGSNGGWTICSMGTISLVQSSFPASRFNALVRHNCLKFNEISLQYYLKKLVSTIRNNTYFFSE